MIGPIFHRETATLPRRGRHYIARVVFALMVFGIICTTWLLMAGIQPVQNPGDLAKFGVLIFQLIAPFQLIVLMFTAALAGTTAVSHEKDKQTIILLLMTSLTNTEVVLGKIGAGLLASFNAFLAACPVMFLVLLLGGVAPEQVLAATWITACTLATCAALGATLAFWREKTFQALAVTVLLLAFWLAFGEAVATGLVAGIPSNLASLISPLRAIIEATQPLPSEPILPFDISVGNAFFAGAVVLLIGIASTVLSIARLRVWNPSRERRPVTAPSEDEQYGTLPTIDTITKDRVSDVPSADSAVPGKRDVKAWKSRPARKVWNNPVLWREMRTWAYGRKVVFVRFAYLLFALIVGFGLQRTMASGVAYEITSFQEKLVPETVSLLAPFIVLSLIIVNALAVNSITNERDGGALDLLLVTEITPPSFLLGKLLGVLYVTKEMVLAPLALCVFLWWGGGLGTENLIFTLLTLVVMVLFVTMLGIHCGMIYSQSRVAIGTSLGTVFFLFLGIAVCMLIMLMFRGSFGRQLAPFLFIILGGGTGLYMALGSRNPSPAITASSFLLPFLTFFAITSFLLRDQELTVFLTVAISYAFATAAMMVPALSEFDFAFGKTRTVDEE
ncbi:MAG: ABC transporter permease subunit [Pirellula sp.]|jgi:ABC-type transport system involved in multi-copper enzyme maturation permease subunit